MVCVLSPAFALTLAVCLVSGSSATPVRRFTYALLPQEQPSSDVMTDSVVAAQLTKEASSNWRTVGGQRTAKVTFDRRALITNAGGFRFAPFADVDVDVALTADGE